MANGQITGPKPEARPRIHSRGIRRLRQVEPLSLPLTTMVLLVKWVMNVLPINWLFTSLPTWISGIIPTWLVNLCPTWLANWIQWCPTSAEALEKAEQDLLCYLKKPFVSQYVEIDSGWNTEDSNQIWTLMMNTNTPPDRTPLVALHGFASGIGLWVMNADSLASERPLYAFDMLGFGRSSRPTFSTSAVEAEVQLVESVEKWRVSLNLNRFILLGHSMGGFLATAYALQYPDHVAHLILADPWGFLERPISLSHQYQLPTWIRAVAAVLRSFNPLAGIRAAGPAGPLLVGRFRSDLWRRFKPLIRDRDTIANYIYHCNAQTPSGEAAFKVMTGRYGWAKHPMISRIGDLRRDVPITFIYGSRSWVNRQPGIQIKYMRLNSFVDVKVIAGAGHHVYADKPEQFNMIVNSVCATVDIAEAKRRRTLALADQSTSSCEQESVQGINVGASTSKLPS